MSASLKYVSNIFWQIYLTFKRIHVKYFLIIQRLAQYILYIMTFILYIFFFHVGKKIKWLDTP